MNTAWRTDEAAVFNEDIYSIKKKKKVLEPDYLSVIMFKYKADEPRAELYS